MRRAILVVLCLILAAWCAWGGEKIATIDGQEVVPGTSFAGVELFDIGGIRFYTAKLKTNDADCTIITGTVLSHAPNQNYVLTIEIDFFESWVNASGRGTARIEVDRPMPGKPVKFMGLGPAWCVAKARGEDKRAIGAHYILRSSVRPYKPPVFDKPLAKKHPPVQE